MFCPSARLSGTDGPAVHRGEMRSLLTAVQVEKGSDAPEVEHEPVLDVRAGYGTGRQSSLRHFEQHPATLGVVADPVALIPQERVLDVVRAFHVGGDLPAEERRAADDVDLTAVGEASQLVRY